MAYFFFFALDLAVGAGAGAAAADAAAVVTLDTVVGGFAVGGTGAFAAVGGVADELMAGVA